MSSPWNRIRPVSYKHLDRPTAIPGEALYSGLKARGVLVRHFNKPRIAEYVRITIGTPEQMEALYAAIEDILKGGAPCAKQP